MHQFRDDLRMPKSVPNVISSGERQSSFDLVLDITDYRFGLFTHTHFHGEMIALFLYSFYSVD